MYVCMHVYILYVYMHAYKHVDERESSQSENTKKDACMLVYVYVCVHTNPVYSTPCCLMQM